MPLDSQSNQRNLATLVVALALTWIAGFVDAVGWLAYAHVYVANMSGNSVAVGIDLGRSDFSGFLKHFWPVLVYVLGLVCGRTMLEVAARLRVQRVASAAFGCEVLILSAVAWSGGHLNGPWLEVGLLAFTMGLQNASLTRFSSLTLHSGFVTGTLVKFAEEGVKFGAWLWDERQRADSLAAALSKSWNEESFRRSGILAFVWVAYILGAILGAMLYDRLGTRSLSLPILGLLSLILLDLRRPLAVKDEELQIQTA